MRPDPRRFKERAARRESFLKRGAVHKPICHEDGEKRKQGRDSRVCGVSCPVVFSLTAKIFAFAKRFA